MGRRQAWKKNMLIRKDMGLVERLLVWYYCVKGYATAAVSPAVWNGFDTTEHEVDRELHVIV
jgi:hypothetical protein